MYSFSEMVFDSFSRCIWRHTLELVCKGVCLRHGEANWIMQLRDLKGSSKWLLFKYLNEFFHLKCDLVFQFRHPVLLFAVCGIY